MDEAVNVDERVCGTRAFVQSGMGSSFVKGGCVGLAAAVVLALASGCNMEQFRRQQAAQHVAAGDAALARDDLKAALKEFDAAIRLSPTLASAYARIADVQRKSGNHEQACTYYAEALRLDPSDFFSAFNLGQMHQLLAAKAVDKVRRLEAAIRAYLHACELRPDSFEANLNLGVCNHQLGRLADAIDYYKKAVAADSSNGHAYINLGAAYEQQQRYYEAIRAYKSALECGSDQAVVHVSLGTIYLKQGRMPAAINSFETALKLDRKLALAHERLAYCRYREGRYVEALEGYNRAIELDNRRAESFAGRGVVEMTLHLKDPKNKAFRARAIEDWHRSLELDPDQARLRGLLAKYRGPSVPAAASP